MDAKDILGLPKNPIPGSADKKPRPPKESQRKPDGISREVYALTGGLAPLMPALDINHLKRKAQSENQKEPYNITQETERKCALTMVLSQTKQQERRDAEVIAEAKRIYEARKAQHSLLICPSFN